MGDYTPVNSDNVAFSATVGATPVTGGQLVEVGASDNTVIPAAGVKRAIGVASKDAGVGERIAVYVLPGMVHEILVKSGITLAVGAPVVVDTTAAGQINTSPLGTAAAAGLLIGICTKGSGTAGDGTTVKARFVGV